jgi:hypothetical protein
MRYISLLVVSGAMLSSSVTYAVDAKDATALRRQCAHLVKVKLGIKETGDARDLASVKGAAQMVDQCVANGGKY